MTKLLKILLLGFLAFGFVACDEVSEVVDSASKAVDTATKEGKKFAKALSIEQPLLRAEFNDKYDDMILYIQSQDNNTIIEDIIINRGNCGVMKYETDYDMAVAYDNTYPDRNGQLRTTNGELVKRKDLIWSKEQSYYDSLDSDSKSTYKPIFPIKLAYGKKFEVPYQLIKVGLYFGQIIRDGKKFEVPYQLIKVGLYFGQIIRDCKTDDIIEVEVIVNGGGSIIYKPKELMLF